MRRVPSPLVVAASLVALPAAVAGQVPTWSLGRAEAVLPDAFSSIRGVRELASGRVLVADWIEERVALVDLDAGTATDRVTRGPGPQEVRLPSSLVPMRGDSTLLVDLGNSRLSVLGPDGRIARSMRADRPGMTGVRGVDPQGGLWYAVPSWAAGADALSGDSVRLVRHDPANGAVRQVAVLLGTRWRSDQGPSREPRIPVIGYGTQDAWALLPDGALVVVRSLPYRIEVTPAGGRPGAGPRVECVPRPVTEADRVAFVREFLASSPTSGRGPDGGMGHTPSADEAEIRRFVRGTEFAETHPCFDAGRVIAAPEGRTWVGRGGPAGEPETFDVFDGSGRPVATVRVPAARRIVAVGERGVYAVRTGEQGLESLERYRLPG